MKPKKLLLVQAGTPPQAIRDMQGDLSSWFTELFRHHVESFEIKRVFEGESLPPPNADTVAVISGSWSMVTEQLAWSESVAEWIRKAVSMNAPVFGVCYGHQLMAHALGGTVGWLPSGREAGTKRVELTLAAAEDPLLKGFPDGFNAHLTHLQTILTLPPGAVTLASSSQDANQIVRYGCHAFSTQYHPEFTASISRHLIMYRAEVLYKEGYDVDQLLNEVTETPEATEVLHRFLGQYYRHPELSRAR